MKKKLQPIIVGPKQWWTKDEICADFYICPKCNIREIQSDFNFCPMCGTRIKVIDEENA